MKKFPLHCRHEPFYSFTAKKLSTHQRRFSNGRMSPGLKMIKVNAAGNGLTRLIASIPNYCVIARGFQLIINQRRDFFAKQVVNFQRHALFSRQAIPNRRGRISRRAGCRFAPEGVGKILRQFVGYGNGLNFGELFANEITLSRL